MKPLTAPVPPPPVAPAHSASRGPAIAAGLLLVAPAVIALLIGYVWPTLRTIMWSFQNFTPLAGGGGEWVGFDNYRRIPGEFFGSFGFALALAAVPLVALLVVGPLLALTAHHAGKPGRLTVRVVLGVLMVLIAPVPLAAAWTIELWNRDVNLSLHTRIWATVALSLFGVACAVGGTLYLAVLRGRRPGGSAWPAGLVVGGLVAITAAAVALQAFTSPYIMSGQLVTPLTWVNHVGFLQLDFGLGAAHATLLLVPLMLLGIAAALLVVLSGLRVEAAPAPAGGRPGAVVAAVLGALLVAGVAVVGLLPWLAELGQWDPTVAVGDVSIVGPSAATLVARTWLPTLASTVLGVGLAALAGYGIGAMRPLGRWSELLLLPFAPWLFVGVGPLVLSHWYAAQTRPIERVDTLLGLVPPGWLVVPALFAFTLLFRGMSRHLGYGRMLVWGLPMLGLVGAATWLVQSQALLWPLTVATSSVTHPAPLHLLRNLAFALQGSDVPYGLPYPLPFIVIFAVGAVLLQLFYLDRLAIRVGRES